MESKWVLCFSLFVNNFLIKKSQKSSLIKYADDSTLIIPVCKGATGESEKVLDKTQFIERLKKNYDR